MTAVDRVTVSLLLVSVLLFVVSVATGAYLTAESGVGDTERVDDGKTVESIQTTPRVNSLLVNNLTAIALLTVFPFCLVVLLLNGFNIGRIVGVGLRTDQLDTVVALVGPHGVFEFSAMFVAGAVGLRLPYELIQYLRGRKDDILDRADLFGLLRLLGVAVGLTVVAAVVEAHLTLDIARWILR